MTTTPPILTAADISSVVSLDDAREAARDAFRALHLHTVESPAPWHLDIAESGGEVHVKGASLAGAQYFAVKVSSGFPRNRALGLPTSDGLSAVIDTATGRIAALVLDGGLLTALRTGAAGALAIELVAPPEVDEFAVIGTGAQARFQIDAALAVRSPSLVTLYGRDLPQAEALADWVRSRSDARVRVGQLDGARIDAQAIMTVTTSTSPVLSAGQVAPGTQITAMGADSPGKREIDPELLRKAALIAVDDIEQSRRLGELQGLDELPQVTTLGALLVEGRPPLDPTAITVADLSGTGAQDAAIAALAVSRLLG